MSKYSFQAEINELMSLIINSNVAAFRTNCTIGTTLGDLAKAAVCS